MTLVDAIIDLTARTPSGGRCEVGGHAFIVRYSSHSWEWEYQGHSYYDPQDLADAMNRTFGVSSHLVG